MFQINAFITRYINYLGNGEHRAGGRVGSDKHYIEQHERGSKVTGVFQKKVKVFIFLKSTHL